MKETSSHSSIVDETMIFSIGFTHLTESRNQLFSEAELFSCLYQMDILKYIQSKKSNGDL